MRFLEAAISILLVIYSIKNLIAGSRFKLLNYLPTIALICLVFHLFIEGQRLQMIPLYGFTAIAFLMSLPALLKSTDIITRPSVWTVAGRILTLIFLVISIAIPVLLPVPTLLKPSGSYPVGTVTMALTDTTRKEIYSGKDEYRKFLIEIWYPAISPTTAVNRAPWMPDAKIVAPAIADYINLPHFFLNHLTLAKSWSYENIQVNRTDGPFPVLIFSHGWNGFRQQSTFLMQELASHGYIVVAMEHPYGARLSVFPDGTIIPNNPNALPKGKPTEEYEAAARILVDQWAGDIGFALTYLSALNQNDSQGQFTNMFAIEKVGIFGHSTGGGAAIQFCSIDSRCKAGLTLDAFVRPLGLIALEKGTRQPFFYMFSELWPFERNTELFQRYYSHVDQSNQVVYILGADHYDFSDLPALSPLAAQLGLKGQIDGKRVQYIIDSYVLAFFDREFNNKPTNLFDGPQLEYPDVRYGNSLSKNK